MCRCSNTKCDRVKNFDMGSKQCLTQCDKEKRKGFRGCMSCCPDQCTAAAAACTAPAARGLPCIYSLLPRDANVCSARHWSCLLHTHIYSPVFSAFTITVPSLCSAFKTASYSNTTNCSIKTLVCPLDDRTHTHTHAQCPLQRQQDHLSELLAKLAGRKNTNVCTVTCILVWSEALRGTQKKRMWLSVRGV